MNFLFQDNDPCKSSPCANSGNCFSVIGSGTYTCTCAQGFTGLYCQTGLILIILLSYLKKKFNIIVIALCGLTCQNGGVCKLINGIQQCSCPAFFSGTNCQTCIRS